MSLVFLDKTTPFPPVEWATPDGLLAIGGDLSPERLLSAYRKGIFPWYEGDYILWWCPDPRFVLFPQDLKVSASLKSLLKKDRFHFGINQAFEEVIRQCKMVKRTDQDGTWITDEMESAYIRLHEMGYAHSAEAWNGNRLVGGLYGVRIRNVFFGESMFSLENNASKFAFVHYVKLLQSEGVRLIDCQVYTSHLESFGAKMIPRKKFVLSLQELLR